MGSMEVHPGSSHDANSCAQRRAPGFFGLFSMSMFVVYVMFGILQLGTAQQFNSTIPT